ncbi:MAG: hypothetical protein AAGH15_04375 [Myxococcota bacterium]
MNVKRKPSSEEVRRATGYVPKEGDVVWAHVAVDENAEWRLGVVRTVGYVDCALVIPEGNERRQVTAWRHRIVPSEPPAAPDAAATYANDAAPG